MVTRFRTRVVRFCRILQQVLNEQLPHTSVNRWELRRVRTYSARNDGRDRTTWLPLADRRGRTYGQTHGKRGGQTKVVPSEGHGGRRRGPPPWAAMHSTPCNIGRRRRHYHRASNEGMKRVRLNRTSSRGSHGGGGPYGLLPAQLLPV